MTLLSSTNIEKMALELGADVVGIAPAGPVNDGDRFKEWLASGFHGTMNYMERNVSARLNPTELLPDAKSIISIGVNYYPTMSDLSGRQSRFNVSKYAWGEDYHIVLRKILENLRSGLTQLCPNLRGRICVDTAPFMDKYWAQMAGLGWQGKHTNLASREFGSWLLLGNLIINIEADKYNNPHPNHCGKCNACIKACPTGAIIAPYQLDATRCISYWTIESRAERFPDYIIQNLQSCIFGCDLCISACPFNRFQKPHKLNNFDRRDAIHILECGDIDRLSGKDFDLLFAGSPISRPGLFGINRNINIARTIP